MKLSIENFAKIKKADIVIDGITVIAGENNTGKSTVGKILFSIYNALSGIEDKILDERLNEIESTNKMILQNYISATSMPRNLVSRNAFTMARRINIHLRDKMNESISISNEAISEIVKTEIEKLKKVNKTIVLDGLEDAIKEISKNIDEVLFISEDTITLEAISRYFNNVFHGQINALAGNERTKAILNLEIKGKCNKLSFVNNVCNEFTNEIDLIHKAIYIDNPFIADELSSYNDLNPMNDLLKKLLTVEKEGVLDGVIETVRAKEKLSDIYQTLQNVVDGEIFLNKDDEFYLKISGCDEPIAFHNLSTGIKSFVILKMLLEKGSLKDKDVVVLDEPEIHLHPQWQIAYAELIVLLQKHFELSVIVTTHSPYFVDAVNLFSCKYNINHKVNYYLSSNEDDGVRMENVTENIDMIYKKMASPIQILDTLRYELNNN